MHNGSLPAPPSSRHLKNQARDLLKSYHVGHPAARVRFREAMPRPSTVPTITSYNCPFPSAPPNGC